MILADLIQSNNFKFTKSESKVAKILLANSQVTALNTVYELAERSNVSTASVLRFFSKLGYDSFTDFKNCLKQSLEEQYRSPVQLVENSSGNISEKTTDEIFFNSVLSNIQSAESSYSAVDIERLSDCLKEEKNAVYFKGGRISSGLARIFYANLSIMRKNVHFLEMGISEEINTLSNMKKKDILIVFDFRRYQNYVISFAQEAKNKKMRIILFTDEWMSPIAKFSDYIFSVKIKTGLPYDSLIGSLYLIEKIVAHMTEKSDKQFFDRFKNLRNTSKNLISRLIMLDAVNDSMPSTDSQSHSQNHSKKLKMGAPVFKEPVSVVNDFGNSPLLLVCEHASSFIPPAYNNLGITKGQVNDHIGWDIGSFALSKELARQLNCCLIYQNYSRLLVDCNRTPDCESFIPVISEDTGIPGNLNLTGEEKELRTRQIWEPFKNGLSDILTRRINSGQKTIVISVHSFTPVFLKKERHCHFGILYNQGKRLAETIHDALTEHRQYNTVYNEPYEINSDDQTVPFIEKFNIPCVLLEIRNDLIRTSAQQKKMVDLLHPVFKQCEGV